MKEYLSWTIFMNIWLSFKKRIFDPAVSKQRLLLGEYMSNKVNTVCEFWGIIYWNRKKEIGVWPWFSFIFCVGSLILIYNKRLVQQIILFKVLHTLWKTEYFLTIYKFTALKVIWRLLLVNLFDSGRSYPVGIPCKNQVGDIKINQPSFCLVKKQ